MCMQKININFLEERVKQATNQYIIRFYRERIDTFTKTLGEETEYGTVITQELIDTLKKRHSRLCNRLYI